MTFSGRQEASKSLASGQEPIRRIATLRSSVLSETKLAGHGREAIHRQEQPEPPAVLRPPAAPARVAAPAAAPREEPAQREPAERPRLEPEAGG